jgi:hypothetical protein
MRNPSKGATRASGRGEVRRPVRRPGLQGGNADGCSRQWIPREVLLSGPPSFRTRSQKRFPEEVSRGVSAGVSRSVPAGYYHGYCGNFGVARANTRPTAREHLGRFYNGTSLQTDGPSKQMGRPEKAAGPTSGSSLPAHHCRFITAREDTGPELQPRVKP